MEFTKLIEIAHNEKDIENAYREAFRKQFKDMEITSPFGCDGFGESKSEKIRVLFEFKDDLDLSNKTELAKVVAQSVYYVKKFYNQGLIPPSTVFIGDRNECLTFHVNDILPYLNLDLDWSIAPSSAYKNLEFLTNIINDDKIKPFVYDAKDFLSCIKKVKELTDNIQRKVLVTEKNITEVFRYFDEKVLIKSELNTNEKVNLFTQFITNQKLINNTIQHYDKKSKTINTKNYGDIKISSIESFTTFFSHFTSSTDVEEKKDLTRIIDRIIEDTTRRKQGEFFTPKIWVDKAHEYIASVFGEDWKEKYVVWDPAWGTGNLTRDYRFKELYCSTLNQSDIDTANHMGYNPEAVKFQYDFLNDDYEKLPVGLRNAIENGKKIIVLMNPPYGTAGNKGEGENKKGISINLVNEEMKNEKMGRCVEQLYIQFVYRLMKMKIQIITMFTPPTLFVSESFETFRKKRLIHYDFKTGFLMDSANFADVKSWGLSFSILEKSSEKN